MHLARRSVPMSPEKSRPTPIALTFRPLGPERWEDAERLFGERGACGGCWCMWYRLPRREYEAGRGETNRSRLRARVSDPARSEPGILAYDGDEPIGWCAVAPREEYLRLRTTRIMRSPDGLPAWAILCLFVAASHRGAGVSVRLLEEAARLAFERGARAVEGYPVIPRREMPPVFASQGTLSAFLRAGFHEVGRPTGSRAVVRKLAPGGDRPAPAGASTATGRGRTPA